MARLVYGMKAARRPVAPSRTAMRRDAVLVGQPVGVEPVQAELAAQPARQSPCPRPAPGCGRSPCWRRAALAAAPRARPGSARADRRTSTIRSLDARRLRGELGVAPAPVGRVVVEVERAARSGRALRLGGTAFIAQSPLSAARRAAAARSRTRPPSRAAPCATASGTSTAITWSITQRWSFSGSGGSSRLPEVAHEGEVGRALGARGRSRTRHSASDSSLNRSMNARRTSSPVRRRAPSRSCLVVLQDLAPRAAPARW